jgi:hypothetical protein
MGIYNGVWEHLYRRYLRGEVDAKEEDRLLASQDANSNQLTFTPGSSNVPSGAGVYIAQDKDSVNL